MNLTFYCAEFTCVLIKTLCYTCNQLCGFKAIAICLLFLFLLQNYIVLPIELEIFRKLFEKIVDLWKRKTLSENHLNGSALLRLKIFYTSLPVEIAVAHETYSTSAANISSSGSQSQSRGSRGWGRVQPFICLGCKSALFRWKIFCPPKTLVYQLSIIHHVDK